MRVLFVKGNVVPVGADHHRDIALAGIIVLSRASARGEAGTNEKGKRKGIIFPPPFHTFATAGSSWSHFVTFDIMKEVTLLRYSLRSSGFQYLF